MDLDKTGRSLGMPVPTIWTMFPGPTSCTSAVSVMTPYMGFYDSIGHWACICGSTKGK